MERRLPLVRSNRGESWGWFLILWGGLFGGVPGSIFLRTGEPILIPFALLGVLAFFFGLDQVLLLDEVSIDRDMVHRRTRRLWGWSRSSEPRASFTAIRCQQSVVHEKGKPRVMRVLLAHGQARSKDVELERVPDRDGLPRRASEDWANALGLGVESVNADGSVTRREAGTLDQTLAEQVRAGSLSYRPQGWPPPPEYGFDASFEDGEFVLTLSVAQGIFVLAMLALAGVFVLMGWALAPGRGAPRDLPVFDGILTVLSVVFTVGSCARQTLRISKGRLRCEWTVIGISAVATELEAAKVEEAELRGGLLRLTSDHGEILFWVGTKAGRGAWLKDFLLTTLAGGAR